MKRELRPGFKFHNGRLMITTDEQVKMIESWPDLKAIRKLTENKFWEKFVPVSRLLRPKSARTFDSLGPGNVRSMALDPLYEKYLAFYHFRNAIPPEITKSVERFSSRQWMLLSLCKRRERAKDLLEQNPALGFGVAHLGKFRPHVPEPLSTAVKVSALRQRDMLGWVGFPKTQVWANILAKIPAEAVTVERLRSLGMVATRPEVEHQLKHLHSVNGWVIALVSERRFADLVSPTLLTEIAEATDAAVPQAAFHLLEDLLNMGQRLPRPNPQSIRNLAALRKRHEEVSAAFVQLLEREKENQILPLPPLPGTPEIVPLIYAEDLIQEGRAQHNCVGSYSGWVHAGYGFIYRVLAPERATLSIVKGADGCWGINELKLACNKSPAPETVQAVQAWLNQYSLSV